MKNYQVLAALVLAIINQALTQENQIKAAWCGCIEQQLNQTTANNVCFTKLKFTAAKVAQEIGHGTQASDVTKWLKANEETVKCNPQDETEENIKEGLTTFQIATATVFGVVSLMLIIVLISLIVTKSLKFRQNAVPKNTDNPPTAKESIEMTNIVEPPTVQSVAETSV